MSKIGEILKRKLSADGKLMPILGRTLLRMQKEKTWETALEKEWTHKMKVLAAEDKDTRTKYLHPSSFSGCSLAVLFKFLRAPRDPNPDPESAMRSQVIFQGGHTVHLLLQTLAKNSDLESESEIPFRYEPMRMEGHADQTIKAFGVSEIGEWKSSNENSIRSLKEPYPDHVDQAHCYYIGLQNDKKKRDISRVRFIYMTRDFGNHQEFVVPIDAKILARLKEKSEMLIDRVARAKLIPRPYKSPSESPCRYCSYMSVCWNPGPRKEFEKTLEPGKYRVHKFPSQAACKKEVRAPLRRPVLGVRKRKGVGA